MWVLHRRAGKSILCINELIDEALRNPLLNPQYAYLMPTYGQAKKVAWNYLKSYSAHIPGVDPKEGDLKLVIKRPKGMKKINQNLEHTLEEDCITIYLLGGDNPDSHRGLFFDGVVLDEFADISPVIWSQIFRPAISDRYTLSLRAREKFGVDSCRIQGWAIFISTPKPNHFKDLYEMAQNDPKWHTFLLPASKSGIIPKEELEDMQKAMPHDDFLQEMECSFTQNLQGAYYSKYIQELSDKGAICNLPHNPSLPVAAFFDIGISDSCSCWFVQKSGGGYNLINYLEFIGMGLEEIIKLIFKLPYTFSTFNFPHDANKREFFNGKTIISQAEQLGCRPSRLIPRCKKKNDMISSARLILPMCKFDAHNCRDGINALKSYQRIYDIEKKCFKDEALHDWSSHGADSFGYFAQGVDDSTFLRAYEHNNSLPTQAIMDYNEFN